MSFASIIGHETAKDLLQRAVESARLPAAYLFAGPPNVGKTLTAVQLAKAINCEQPTDADCCDECSSCRHIEEGVHPNFSILRPVTPKQEQALEKAAKEAAEKNEGDQSNKAEGSKYKTYEFPEVVGGLIGIDTIRGLIASANAKVAVGKRKVYVITSAEAMQGSQAEAANCFLRTLEEPPGPTTFILTTTHISDLLPTIVSRCQIVNFQPVPREEALPALKKKFPEVADETIEAVVASSAGRYGWAYRLLESEQALAQRKAVLDLMASLPSRGLFEGMRTGELLIEATEKWWLARKRPVVAEGAKRLLQANRDNVLRTQMNELTDVMFSWWRDISLLVASPQTEKVINTDYLSQLRQLARNYDASRCQRACRWILEAKLQLRGPANLQLCTQVLMMKLISLSPANL